MSLLCRWNAHSSPHNVARLRICARTRTHTHLTCNWSSKIKNEICASNLLLLGRPKNRNVRAEKGCLIQLSINLSSIKRRWVLVIYIEYNKIKKENGATWLTPVFYMRQRSPISTLIYFSHVWEGGGERVGTLCLCTRNPTPRWYVSAWINGVGPVWRRLFTQCWSSERNQMGGKERES